MKILLVVFFMALASIAFPQDADWSINGYVLSTDNCVIGCPCILGEQPTHGRCTYTGIAVIEKGYYNNVKLDNTKFALGGAFGRPKEMAEQEYDFSVFYIDAAASTEQKAALKKIIESGAFEGMGKPVEIKEAPITVFGTEGFGQVGKTYGGMVGDFMKIEITPVSGAINNKPIIIENSAEPLFYWTALGKATDSYFKAAGQNWVFNGTSGESHRFSMNKSGTVTDMSKGHH